MKKYILALAPLALLTACDDTPENPPTDPVNPPTEVIHNESCPDGVDTNNLENQECR